LKGTAFPERALFWHYPHYGNQGGAPGAAIRRGKWKLIEWSEDTKVELYNLDKDLSETKNVALLEKAVTDRMLEELHAWQKSVGAQFPIVNASYDASKQDGRFAARKAN
jgi:arylsulfatase A-like enzyme